MALVYLLFLVLFVVNPCEAQIPEVCFNTNVCCPIPIGSVFPCGSDLNQGECVDVSLISNINLNGPRYPFSKVCQCSPGYYDYDCGYTFNQKKVRKNFLSMTETEKTGFLRAMNAMKTSGELWAYNNVILNSYDIFTYLHSMAMHLDPLNNFAHEGPSFPTWHRSFLLKFEDELRGYGWNQGLPYWNWTDVATRDQIWDYFGNQGVLSSCSSTRNESLCCEVAGECWEINTGPFKTWGTVLSNGTLSKEKIQRQFGCHNSAASLPSYNQVTKTLGQTIYDDSPFNQNSYFGFRSWTEGFHESPNGTYSRSMHNQVHIYIGHTMCNVDVSPNDPIFWVHHCFTDLIFEKWLHLHPKAEYVPQSISRFGQAKSDALVPLFPYVSNEQMFKTSQHFGYIYDEYASASASFLDVSIILFLSLLQLIFF